MVWVLSSMIRKWCQQQVRRAKCEIRLRLQQWWISRGKVLFVFTHKSVVIVAVLFSVTYEYIRGGMGGGVVGNINIFCHSVWKETQGVNKKRAFMFLNGRISELQSWGSPTDFAHTNCVCVWERSGSVVDSAETLNSIWVIQLISASD